MIKEGQDQRKEGGRDLETERIQGREENLTRKRKRSHVDHVLKREKLNPGQEKKDLGLDRKRGKEDPGLRKEKGNLDQKRGRNLGKER